MWRECSGAVGRQARVALVLLLGACAQPVEHEPVAAMQEPAPQPKSVREPGRHLQYVIPNATFVPPVLVVSLTSLLAAPEHEVIAASDRFVAKGANGQMLLDAPLDSQGHFHGEV